MFSVCACPYADFGAAGSDDTMAGYVSARSGPSDDGWGSEDVVMRELGDEEDEEDQLGTWYRPGHDKGGD